MSDQLGMVRFNASELLNIGLIEGKNPQPSLVLLHLVAGIQFPCHLEAS